MFGDAGAKNQNQAKHIPTRGRGCGRVLKTFQSAFPGPPSGAPPGACSPSAVGAEPLWGQRYGRAPRSCNCEPPPRDL